MASMMRSFSYALFALSLSIINLTGITAQPIFNVKTYGAVGDGVHNDTLAVQAALSAAAKSSSSIVLFPGPSTYLTWPLRVVKANNMLIQFEPQALVLAPKMSDWPHVWPYGDSFWVFQDGSNLTLQGAGQYETAIDGQGADWWAAYRKHGAKRPTAFLNFESVVSPTVRHLQYINSPSFHLVFNSCTNVLVEDASIYAPGDSPNTDGIDPGRCNGVTVRRTNISNGDDCVAIKSGTSNVLIEDSYFENGHGASIGSLGENGANDTVTNVLVRNVTFVRTMGAAKVKAWQGGRGFARNLTWTNCTFVSVQTPLQFTQFYCPHDPSGCDPKNTTVLIQDISVYDSSGTQSDGHAAQFACTEMFPCTGISLSNVHIASDEGPNGKNDFTCENAHGTAVNVSPPSCLKP